MLTCEKVSTLRVVTVTRCRTESTFSLAQPTQTVAWKRSKKAEDYHRPRLMPSKLFIQTDCLFRRNTVRLFPPCTMSSYPSDPIKLYELQISPLKAHDVSTHDCSLLEPVGGCTACEVLTAIRIGSSSSCSPSTFSSHFLFTSP